MIRPKSSSVVLLISTIILACMVIVGWSKRSQASSKVGWEYKIVTIAGSGKEGEDPTPLSAYVAPERYFNELGAEGWELVQFLHPEGTLGPMAGSMPKGYWIFKRAR